MPYLKLQVITITRYLLTLLRWRLSCTLRAHVLYAGTTLFISSKTALRLHVADNQSRQSEQGGLLTRASAGVHRARRGRSLLYGKRLDGTSKGCSYCHMEYWALAWPRQGHLGTKPAPSPYQAVVANPDATGDWGRRMARWPDGGPISGG